MTRRRNNSGYTLVELGVATILVGILGLALSSAFTLMTQIQQNARAISDVQELQSVLKMQLANRDVCKQVMGVKGSTTNPAGTVVPAGTVTGLGSMPYSIYRHPSTTPTTFIGSVPAVSPTNNEYGHVRVNSLNLQILQATVGQTATQAVGALQMSVTKRATGGRLGNQSYDILIPVGLLIDRGTAGGTGAITSCAAVAVDLAVPQCGAGQHLVLQVQSGSPTPTQWVCQ